MQRRQLLAALFTKPHMLATLGFGCFLTWSQIELISLFETSVGMACSPLFIACVASWVLVAVLASRASVALTNSHRRITTLVLLVMAVTSVVSYLVITGYLQSLPSFYLLAVLKGISFSGGFLIWSTVLRSFDKSLMLGVALCALVIAGLFDVLVGFMDAGIIGLVQILFVGIVAVVLLMGERSFHSSDKEQDAKTEKGERLLAVIRSTIKPYRRFSVAYLLYACVFGITFGVSAFSDANDTSALFSNFAPSLVVGTIALLCAWVLFEHKGFSLKTIGFVISPLLVVFYILYLIMSGETLLVVVDFTFALWWVTEVFVVLTIVVIVHDVRKPLRLGVFAFLWAWFCTAFAIGILFGQVATFVFGSQGIVPTIITGLSVIVVMAATSLQIGAKTPLDKNAQNFDSPEQSEGSENIDTVALICGRIAQKNKLTPREEEVLILLAQGHTRNSIAKKLFVSDNTVRAHTKSLYHKLHIHSKQELVDIIEAQRQSTCSTR